LEEILKEFDKDSVEFIIATGEPVARKSIYNKLKDFSLNCISIIDQNFKLSSSSSIEEGTIVHTGAVITCNVHVGKGCFINKGVVIGHDVTLGDFCVISPNATISGDVEIGENCYIGSGAVIRNGVTIGRDSIIGMGAVVLEDVKPESVMVGNPAKLLRKNESKKVF
jgi:sugar O-acyltransferase (sialic acid O-acetyltransferase NeuD family)